MLIKTYKEKLMHKCTIVTPLGAATATASDNAITGFWFVGQKYYPDISPDNWITEEDYPAFQLLRNWVSDYFEGRNTDAARTLIMDADTYAAAAASTTVVKLNPQGSDFRKAVWRILLEIPYGQTTTYGDIAKQLAGIKGLSRVSAQAVGGAVGHNPISLLIPCHRVIGADGSLTGYAGGIDKKQALLNLEKGITTPGISFKG